jgi:hypothetical protein
MRDTPKWLGKLGQRGRDPKEDPEGIQKILMECGME